MPSITYPNQRLIKIHRESAKTDFLGIKNENWKSAARDLSPHALLLYLYLASNADNYLQKTWIFVCRRAKRSCSASGFSGYRRECRTSAAFWASGVNALCAARSGMGIILSYPVVSWRGCCMCRKMIVYLSLFPFGCLSR